MGGRSWLLRGLVGVAALALCAQVVGASTNETPSRSAQRDLVASAIALTSLFNGGFGPLATLISELQSEEPELHFTDGPVTSANPSHQVAVILSPDQKVVLLVDE